MDWRRIDRLLIAFAILLVLAFGGAAAAQDAAGITGLVTDESGAVLPGVTVTATSPALQVPSVVAVTDEQGDYRLTPLPIGTYTVEYTLSGFQTVRREGVRLTVGFTARIDVPMKVGSLEETITVSGAAPVVDTHVHRGDDPVHAGNHRTPADQSQRRRQPAGAGARRPDAARRRRQQPESGADVSRVRAGRRGVLDARRRADEQPAGVERPGELLGLHDARRGVGPHARQQRRSAEPRRQPRGHRQVRRQPVPQQHVVQQVAVPISRATTSTTSCARRASPAARRCRIATASAATSAGASSGTSSGSTSPAGARPTTSSR